MSVARTGARGRVPGAARGRAAVLLLALVSLLAAGSPAWGLTFHAEIDRTGVPVGGQLTLRLIVSGPEQDLPRLRLPALADFDAYGAGSSQNIVIQNGRVEASQIQSYILIPKKEGRFTLGPFELVHAGQTYRTEPVSILVGPADSAPQTSPSPRRGDSGRGGARPVDYFVTADVDKREAYVNEQITLTFKFYSRVNLSRDPEFTPPPATGFWVEDLPPVRRYYEEVNGASYLVNEVKSALFSTAPGPVTIGPATLKVVRSRLADLTNRDPFAALGRDPFGMLQEGRPEILKTKSISVRIRPLPEAGRPADFTGLVGQYGLTASVDKQAVEANQPVTVTLVLRGDGNVQTAPDPRLEPPAGVRSYDVGARTNTTKEGYRLRGEKVIEKTLIPTAPGLLVIPPASIVAFDPRRGAYQRLSTDTLRVRVAAATSAGVGGAGREVRRVGKDIHPIREGPELLAPGAGWLFEKRGFWIAQAIPLALWGLALRAGRTRRILAADGALARSRGAHGVARKRLSQARKALTGGGAGEFYAILAQSMSHYAADKLDLSGRATSREDLIAALEGRGVPAATVHGLRDLLDRCDLGRFAPGGDDASGRQDLLARGEGVILEMERVFRA